VRANVCALAIRSLPRNLAPRFGFRHASSGRMSGCVPTATSAASPYALISSGIRWYEKPEVTHYHR
jgi:hypothetical protein